MQFMANYISLTANRKPCGFSYHLAYCFVPSVIKCKGYVDIEMFAPYVSWQLKSDMQNTRL